MMRNVPSSWLALVRTLALGGSLWLTGCAAAGPSGVMRLAETPDRPELGKQGETTDANPGEVLAVAYSSGIDVIGHDDIGGRAGNLTMAWSQNCAYVASGMVLGADGNLITPPPGKLDGVAVIDVSNPTRPRTVQTLRDKGALTATETLHAASTPRGHILAASTYGGVEGMSAPAEGWLSLYDARSCTAPSLKAEIKWPEPVHTLTISPNGDYVYGTVLNPFTGAGAIEIMDIKDLEHPRFVGKFAITRPDGSSFEFAPHELVFSPDGRRIYVGVVSSKGADAAHEFKAQTSSAGPSPASVGQEAGGLYILDNSDFIDRKPKPELRIVGSAAHAGWHSPVRARIGGVPYVINAGELGACPGAWPRIINVADEKKPVVVGSFRLAMNFSENCPARTAMERATGGMVGRAGIAASHFQDVDDAEQTQLGLFPFMYAGLRIADLRNPQEPTEVAYFKPGDPCASHVHFDAKTKNIWFACNRSGFWVVRLKRDVRSKLGLR